MKKYTVFWDHTTKSRYYDGWKIGLETKICEGKWNLLKFNYVPRHVFDQENGHFRLANVFLVIICFVLLLCITCHNPHPKYIVTQFLAMTNDFGGDHTGQYFHESKSMLKTKLYGAGNWNNIFQMHVLEYPEMAAAPGGRSQYTENVRSSMELRSPLFPHSVCLGSNGFDSRWIWYLLKLRL